MSNLELKWKDCSNNPDAYKKGKFVFRLTNDLMIATVGVCRYEDNKIEAYLEYKQNRIYKEKIYKYKDEDDKKNKIETAKFWAEQEMAYILEKNLTVLKISIAQKILEKK